MDVKTASYPIKRLSQSRIECTVIFGPEEVSRAENSTIERYRKQITVRGFRPGYAPLEMVRAEIGSERLLNEIVRILLPQILSELIQEHQLKPIIPPSVSVVKVSPLTITLILVEHPLVTTKKIPSIEKKAVVVGDEDLQRIIDYTLKQYNQTELTESFVKEKLGGTSVASFKDEVRKNLTTYEEERENRRREHALLDAIRDAVDTDLAPELLTEEERILTEEFLEDLKRANVLLDDWCKHMKKTREDLGRDLKTQAESRLKIRFGIEQLIHDRKITADDPNTETAWKMKVGKLMEELLKV